MNVYAETSEMAYMYPSPVADASSAHLAQPQDQLARLAALLREDVAQHLTAMRLAMVQLDDDADEVRRHEVRHRLELACERTIATVRMLGGEMARLSVSLAQAARSEASMSPQARAIALLYENPHWTDTKIARHAGISRTSLYRWRRYVAAREMLCRGRERFAVSRDRLGDN